MDDLCVVFERRNRRSCSDRALVLAAVQIPYQLIDDGYSCALVVPADYSARAAEELRLYEEENPPARPRPRKKIVYQDALPGVVAYVLIVCVVSWLAGYSFFDANWFAAGRVDGHVTRAGSLTLGTLVMEDIEIAELELPSLNNADGLLGMNFLRQFRFFLDQDQQVLRLSAPLP